MYSNVNIAPFVLDIYPIAINNIIISKLYEILYLLGLIIADNPIINNRLNIFDPIIFPIAISLSPFIAAITLVTNSGKLVPIATIVNPIIFSLIFNCVATDFAF